MQRPHRRAGTGLGRDLETGGGHRFRRPAQRAPQGCLPYGVSLTGRPAVHDRVCHTQRTASFSFYIDGENSRVWETDTSATVAVYVHAPAAVDSLPRFIFPIHFPGNGVVSKPSMDRMPDK